MSLVRLTWISRPVKPDILESVDQFSVVQVLLHKSSKSFSHHDIKLFLYYAFPLVTTSFTIISFRRRLLFDSKKEFCVGPSDNYHPPLCLVNVLWLADADKQGTYKEQVKLNCHKQRMQELFLDGLIDI
ncbi:uncharacterized protein BX664DRAFT_310668 [Halteromyces radiatus]|uniref:uncharacterized protein n=1 Tax=Halteromyces radiatus TaxID=101107 RepID=UPI00221ECB23|nr:uncharacterized protein BX664DRAFT_310668 [Halteromyces radiatus]KAI8099729.1 hypothetical protein BX664DRAFT_310668 [Halteromyces radiatus]